MTTSHLGIVRSLVAGLVVALVATLLPSVAAAEGEEAGPGSAAAPIDTAAVGDGYWMLASNGEVYAFGDAVDHGDAVNRTSDAVALVAVSDGSGYWIVTGTGSVWEFGDAVNLPSARPADRSARIVSGVATATGEGMWVFADDGEVITRGDAVHYGDMSGRPINGSIIDAAVTPDGGGYWLLGSDGGIFAFGNAQFHGSIQGVVDALVGFGFPASQWLAEPIIGLVPSPANDGYWLVAADGGVFSFPGSLPFRGSVPGVLGPGGRLSKPINGMVAYGNGYLMSASDGGVFTFSDKPFLGSLGSTPPPAPIVALTPLPGAIAVSAPPLPGISSATTVTSSGSLAGVVEFDSNPAGVERIELFDTDGDAGGEPDFFVIHRTGATPIEMQFDPTGELLTITVDGAIVTITISDTGFSILDENGAGLTGLFDDYAVTQASASATGSAVAPPPVSSSAVSSSAVSGANHSNVFVERIRTAVPVQARLQRGDVAGAGEWSLAARSPGCSTDAVHRELSWQCRVLAVSDTVGGYEVAVEHQISINAAGVEHRQGQECLALKRRLERAAGRRGVRLQLVAAVLGTLAFGPPGLVLGPVGVAIAYGLGLVANPGTDNAWLRRCLATDIRTTVDAGLAFIAAGDPDWSLHLSVAGRGGAEVNFGEANVLARFGRRGQPTFRANLQVGERTAPLVYDLQRPTTASISLAADTAAPGELVAGTLKVNDGIYGQSLDIGLAKPTLRVVDDEIEGLATVVPYFGDEVSVPFVVRAVQLPAGVCRVTQLVRIDVTDFAGNVRRAEGRLTVSGETGSARDCPFPFSVRRDASPSPTTQELTNGSVTVVLPFTVFGGYTGSNLQLDFRVNGGLWAPASGSPFAHDPLDHFLGRDFARTLRLRDSGANHVEYRIRIGDDEQIVSWTFFLTEPVPVPANCENIGQFGVGIVCPGVTKTAGPYSLVFVEDENRTTDCFNTPGTTSAWEAVHRGSFRYTTNITSLRNQVTETGEWRSRGNLTCLGFAHMNVTWDVVPLVQNVSLSYADALLSAIADELDGRAGCRPAGWPDCEMGSHGATGIMNRADVD